MWWQKAVAVTVVGVSLLAYPVILLQESRVQAGNAVQPRYILPMMLMLVGLSLLRRRGRVWRLNRFQMVVLAGGLALAQSLALYSNLVRYVNGGSTALPTALGGGWWWNGLPVSPLWLWIVGSVAFAAVAAVVLGHGVERVPRRRDAADRRSRPRPARRAAGRKAGRGRSTSTCPRRRARRAAARRSRPASPRQERVEVAVAQHQWRGHEQQHDEPERLPRVGHDPPAVTVDAQVRLDPPVDRGAVGDGVGSAAMLPSPYMKKVPSPSVQVAFLLRNWRSRSGPSRRPSTVLLVPVALTLRARGIERVSAKSSSR